MAGPESFFIEQVPVYHSRRGGRQIPGQFVNKLPDDHLYQIGKNNLSFTLLPLTDSLVRLRIYR
jgi:hypothetical protein